MSQRNGRFLHLCAIMATLLFLSSLAVLLIISPAFLRQQYARLSADSDSLSPRERLELALPAMTYLDSFQSPATAVATLQTQTLPDGSPLYTPAELGHLLDVKHLTDIIRLINLASLLFLLSVLATFSRPSFANFRPTLFRAIGTGGLLTVFLFLLLLLCVALFWPLFFLRFHELLFPPGTWTFSATSGLIRLYPEIFWYRVGLGIVGRIVMLGFVTTITCLILAQRTAQKPLSSNLSLSQPFTLDQVNAWSNGRILSLAQRTVLVVLLAAMLIFSLRTYPLPFSLLIVPCVLFFCLPILQATRQDIAALSRYYHLQLRLEVVGTTGMLALLMGVTLFFARPSAINPDGLVYQGLLVALLLLFGYWVTAVAILLHRYRYPQAYPQE